MKSVLKLVAAALVFLLVAAAILYLAIDRQPSINRAADITPANIERAKQILHDNDPRRLRPGEAQTIAMSAEELDLAANYVAQRYGHGSARVVLGADEARVSASMRIPNIPLVLYTNVDATLNEAEPLPRFERIRIGRVPFPASIADRLLRSAIIQQVGQDNFDAIATAVKKVSVRDGGIAITYEWQTHLEETIRSALLPLKDRERVKTYQERLHKVILALPSHDISIARLLSALFTLAEQRSHDRDPAAENRAPLLILAFYINDMDLEKVIPEARDWPHPVRRAITLKGRDDYSKHFIISAILAAKAGGPLADAVGLHKELADARSASGFSLDDIAADRAGALFGEKAVESAASARKLQVQVAVGLTDDEILPPVQDLPVSMSAAEFKRRFGGPDTPQYRQMLAEIERRLSRLTLYQKQ